MKKVHYIRPNRDSLNFGDQINMFLAQLSDDTELIDIKYQVTAGVGFIVQSALIIYKLP